MIGIEPITCFLPCRKGSERIVNKNVKPFGPFKNGLVELKVRQVLATATVDRLIVSTNDDEILDFLFKLGEQRIVVHEREDLLSLSSTSTDELVLHALDLIPEGHILWTHVTSPFIHAQLYDKVVRAYVEALKAKYDSLMTVTPIHGFLWDSDHPINYDRHVEKWLRTQTLEPINEINSAIFLAPSDVYRELKDRIGRKPILYSLDKITAMDIDWNEDFIIAEQLALSGSVPL